MQGIDAGSLPLIVLGLCALCLVGGILLFGLQIIGALLGSVVDILQLFFEFLSGGPTQWCGCLVVFGGIALCAVLVAVAASALGACDTHPTNFCVLFGR
jgi:hypothetical protein